MSISLAPPFANVTSNPMTIANISSPAVFSAITGLEESVKLNVALFVIGMSIWLLIFCGPKAFEHRAGCSSSLIEWISVRIRIRTSGASTRVTDSDAAESLLSGGTPSRAPLSRSTCALDLDTKSDAAWNYLLFLKMCGLACFTCTVVSFLLFLPFDFGAILFNGGNLFIFFESPACNLAMALVLVFTNGCIALFFAQILQILTLRHELDDRLQNKLDRAIWLKYLPMRDPQTGRAFSLKKEDIKQVELDLTKALNDSIRERMPKKTGSSEIPLKEEDSCIENVHVTRNFVQWISWDRELKAVKESIKGWKMDVPGRATPPFWCRIFGLGNWWPQRVDSKITRLESRGEHLEKQLGSMHYKLAGCAFVILKPEYKEHVEYLLTHDVPSTHGWSCWNRQLRDYRLFSFGRPPFSSVTLRATAAPVPDDIVWGNIHMASQETKTRIITVVFSVLLFFLMTLLVTTTTVSSVAPPLLDVLRRNMRFLNETIGNSSLQDGTKGELSWWLEQVDPDTGPLQSLVEQLPAYILIFINSIVLPFLISRIAGFTRYPLKTSLQEVELNLNYFYLCLNTIVFPLAGVSSIAALVPHVRAWATPYLKELGLVQTQDAGEGVITVLSSSFLNGSAGFLVGKYLIGCTFLTSMSGMWDLGQTITRMFNNWLATTEVEKRIANKPQEFTCGYWYAWTLSIFVLTLTVGFILPTVLPLGCLFFFFRYWVDKYNISTKRYDWGPVDLHGILGSVVVRKIKQAVAFLWLGVGGTLLFESQTGKIGFIDDHPAFCVVGGILVLLSIYIAAVSEWRFQQLARWRTHKRARDFTDWGDWMADVIVKIKILNIAKRGSIKAKNEGDTEAVSAQDIHWRGAVALGLKEPTADDKLDKEEFRFAGSSPVL